VPTGTLIIDERESGEVTVLTLSGQMLLDDGDLAFRLRVHDLIARGRTQLLLDLGGLTYMDSAGIGMIAGKLKTVREAGGDLKLLNLTSRGQRVFGIAKLLILFETFDNEELALKSFTFKAR
jgi:anti-sigma B factor antagonist